MSRHESPEVGAGAARIVKALVRRAGEGDTEALEQLRVLDDLTAQAVSDALRQMHAFGYSWAELARVTGTTRQACSQRASQISVMTKPSHEGDSHEDHATT